ncbi:MAG TPA: D-arabinono-1,4-lactone oxidase [Roseiflexaceae bacterium]|nr:D-arabinono-1,4-lactone oxidase [Roseiflexaceae bacterium]
MTREWSNWSGSLRFTPARVAAPASEEELAELVRRAASEGRTLRAVGAGHSSSPLVETGDTLVSLERLSGVIAHDRAACEAVVWAGTRLRDLGRQLFDLGLGLENYGDVATQHVAGAMSTGTHGSGRRLRNLETHIVGVRAVTARGEIVEWRQEREEEMVRAARVALGALGIFTRLRLRLLPAYRLRRRDFCAQIEDCLAHLEELAERNRNFDFYWYPRSDEAKIRTLNPPEAPPPELPYARLVTEEEGWGHEIIARERQLRFDEMEYMLPAEAGPACFRAVRERVKARWRRTVGWRVLCRLIAADDALLSPAHGRDSVAISIHQNSTLPHQEYFADIEPIFRAYGGRPHWGKKHSLRAPELRPLYPQFDRFLAIRAGLDPAGVFLNPYLRALLGVET